MLQILLLLLILPLSTTGKNESRNKTAAKSSCAFQAPKKVHFTCWNFVNILTWKPANKSKSFIYTVEYKKYGSTTWHTKLECANITLTQCNLSNETHNARDRYSGRVSVNNGSCSKETKRIFDPLIDCKFDPPTINLFPSDTFIEVNLTQPVPNLTQHYKGLQYHLHWINKGLVEFENTYYKLDHLDVDMVYCVQAWMSWRKDNISGLSNRICAKTNPDGTAQKAFKVMFYTLPLVSFIIIVIIVGCCIHQYIHVINLQKPHFLNITANGHRDALLVEAHTVTINLITVDSGELNLHHTIMADREENKDEAKSQSNLCLSNSDYHISSDSSVKDDIAEDADEDHGYDSLQEPVTIARPTISRNDVPMISPYDMPHQLHAPVKPVDSSSDIVHEEGDLYGRIKCNPKTEPVQEKEELDIVQNGCCTPEEPLVQDPYLPQENSDFSFTDKLKDDLGKTEESFNDLVSDSIKEIKDIHINESSTLFLDWSPDSSNIYMPNLWKNRELESCIKQCQQEKEALLSDLYLPLEIKNNSKDDELELLEERWGLHVEGLGK